MRTAAIATVGKKTAIKVFVTDNGMDKDGPAYLIRADTAAETSRTLRINPNLLSMETLLNANVEFGYLYSYRFYHLSNGL